MQIKKSEIFQSQICACGPKFAGPVRGMVIKMKFTDIDESSPDFFDNLNNFYKDKIIIGKKTVEEVLDYIRQKYGINCLTKSDLTERKIEAYHDVK